MKRNWKKAFMCILTGFMLATAGTSCGSGADQRGRSTGAVTVAAPAMSLLRSPAGIRSFSAGNR